MIGSAKRVRETSLAMHCVELACEQCVKKVNNYLLAAKIGSGSSSKVYLGIDQTTGERFAVKRIKLRELCRTSSGIAQLEREIRLMRMFDHRNILKLREVLHISSAQEAYLVLEYAEKGCLGAFVERRQRLSQRSVFSIMKQVATAIKYLHESGFVHQDIKPWNILVDETGRAVLADFGIGHSFQSAAMVVGSPAFQAPEALDESYGYEEDEEECTSYEEGPQKEDIWALGVTLYQLLFMKLPFVGSNLYEIVNVIKERPLEIPEGTDPKIAELLGGMLTIDPVMRWGVDDLLKHELIANADDLAEDLPAVPKLKQTKGEVIQLDANVCSKGYSFASVAMSIQRRLSFINAPFSPDRPNVNSCPFPRTKPAFEQDSSSDGEEIDIVDRHASNSMAPQTRLLRIPTPVLVNEHCLDRGGM